MASRQAYRENPCGTLSLPYWKAGRFPLPDTMAVVHNREYDPRRYTGYDDVPFFRLFHDLSPAGRLPLPGGFVLETALLPRDAEEIAQTINGSYTAIRQSAAQVAAWANSPAYDPALWLMIRRRGSGQAAASGIGELDADMREGTLEWIQVLPAYRGMGLGAVLVGELLARMAGKADFATVSGELENPCSPERLYRRCGFTGNDVWHVLSKRPGIPCNPSH